MAHYPRLMWGVNLGNLDESKVNLPDSIKVGKEALDDFVDD